MLNILLPLMGDIFSALLKNKGSIAKATKTTPDVVERVGEALQAHLTKDERLLQHAATQLEAARAHDVATQTKDIPAVNLARGLVRPFITFAAMSWYIYARIKNIPLQPEDYAIIGGVLAFWFGFRPFEKRKI